MKYKGYYKKRKSQIIAITTKQVSANKINLKSFKVIVKMDNLSNSSRINKICAAEQSSTKNIVLMIIL